MKFITVKTEEGVWSYNVDQIASVQVKPNGDVAIHFVDRGETDFRGEPARQFLDQFHRLDPH